MSKAVIFFAEGLEECEGLLVVDLLRRAGVEDINFHALRHTFATRWIECGLDVKSLACILGHSNVSITLGLYAHPSMDSMRAGMDRLSSARAAASERAANDVRTLP